MTVLAEKLPAAAPEGNQRREGPWRLLDAYAWAQTHGRIWVAAYPYSDFFLVKNDVLGYLVCNTDGQRHGYFRDPHWARAGAAVLAHPDPEVLVASLPDEAKAALMRVPSVAERFCCTVCQTYPFGHLCPACRHYL